MISYPRRRLARGLARAAGRLVLPTVFDIEITGKEQFPQRGPLLVVGNHVAAIEAVLMVVLTPWPVEMLGASDTPHELVTELFSQFYGYIPVNRGHFDRAALTQALEVLKQGGIIGIFPEGGIWQADAMPAQTGTSWLSYRANTPVLPIGFGGTRGALNAGLKLKRPKLTMNIGRVIPAARLPSDMARKAYLQTYAGKILQAIRALLPAADRQPPSITNERFELDIAVRGPQGIQQDIPTHLTVRQTAPLARLFHLPAILKILDVNLRLPVKPLQTLDQEHSTVQIIQAVQSILEYLEHQNPYLLTYRVGPRAAESMQTGLRELLALAQWAAQSNLRLTITPIRRYYSLDQKKEIVQTQQGHFQQWM